MKLRIFFVVLAILIEASTVSAAARSKDVSSVTALNDIDSCIKAIQSNIKGKNTTKNLSGLVGIGWDDLTNSYTLPILKTTFKKCLSDNNNDYLVPDNVFIVQIQDANIERSSTQIDTFKSMMESSSSKVGVAGSATFKGIKIGGSFGSENQQSKESFEKQTSIMFLNKIHYTAFELFVDENDGFDEYFVSRIEDIAAAVAERKMLWGKFLAEVLISDFGTHLINKAKAGAEISQETYIDKSETYKSEKTMDAYKAEISLGFKDIAKITIGYESKKETSETHTTSTVTTSKILKVRGGPNIQRISAEKTNESMLHVENLVGLEQSGKYLYEIISGMKLPKFSDRVKYTVRKLIQIATEDYYRYNFRPGCMDVESENFNKIANVDDDTCMDPNMLFAFSGVYQTCKHLSAKSASGESYYPSNHCDAFQIKNPLNNTFSCGTNITQVKVFSLKKVFNDRRAKVKQEKCGLFSYFFGCKTVVVEIPVIDVIQVDVFWCPIPHNLTEEKAEKRNTTNPLDAIMTHKILHSINEAPGLLRAYFPYTVDEFNEIAKQNICSIDVHEMFQYKYPGEGWERLRWIVNYYDSMARGYTRNDNSLYYYHGKYDILWDNYTFARQHVRKSYFAFDWEFKLLEMKADQFQMLKHYPKALETLLPILKIPMNIRYSKSFHPAISINPEILESILFNKSTIYEKEPPPIMLFGGAFKTGTLNPFTGTYDCPPNFEPMKILLDLNLCLSTDNTLKWPLRLGGFYNCESDLQICPLGYSAYLGTVHDDGCEHFYCIRFHTRDYIMPPVINKPPYTDYKMADKERILSL